MPSVFELLFDTYGDHLMQEQAPYDEAEIQAALDRMSMPQDMQIQVCDLLSSCYLRWGTAAFAIGLGLGLSLMQDCSGSPSTDLTGLPVRRRSSCIRG